MTFQGIQTFYDFLLLQAEKRKTINGEDILFAMSSLGFDNYVEPLKQYLQKYRQNTSVQAVPSGIQVEHFSTSSTFRNTGRTLHHKQQFRNTGRTLKYKQFLQEYRQKTTVQAVPPEIQIENYSTSSTSRNIGRKLQYRQYLQEYRQNTTVQAVPLEIQIENYSTNSTSRNIDRKLQFKQYLQKSGRKLQCLKKYRQKTTVNSISSMSKNTGRNLQYKHTGRITNIKLQYLQKYR